MAVESGACDCKRATGQRPRCGVGAAATRGGLGCMYCCVLTQCLWLAHPQPRSDATNHARHVGRTTHFAALWSLYLAFPRRPFLIQCAALRTAYRASAYARSAYGNRHGWRSTATPRYCGSWFTTRIPTLTARMERRASTTIDDSPYDYASPARVVRTPPYSFLSNWATFPLGCPDATGLPRGIFYRPTLPLLFTGFYNPSHIRSALIPS